MTDQLERRPLVIACIALVVGLSAFQHPLNLLFLVPLVWFARDKRSWLTVVLFLGLGLLLAPRSLPILYERYYVQGPLVVQSIPMDRRLDNDTDEQVADALVGGLRVRLRAPQSPLLRIGDVLDVSGTLRPVTENEDTSYRNQGLQGRLRLGEIRFLRRSPPLFEIPSRVRRDYGQFLLSNLSPEDADIAQAAWFRDGSLSRDEQSQVMRSGSFGYFAASGIQVYMLCGALMALLSIFRIPRAWQAPAVAVALAGFTIATGAHASTFRASLSCVIFLSSFRMGREQDSLSSLSLAAIAYLLLFPRAIYSQGLQLTVAIVAAICLFIHIDKPEEPNFFSTIKHRCKQVLAVTLVIWISGQPILAAHQGKLEFTTLPAILLLGVVLSAVLLGCLFAYVVHWLWLGLAAGVLHLYVLPLLGYVERTIDWLAKHELTFSTPFFNPYWLVLYYGAWMLTWRPRAVRS